jgi:uncharacterized membrane protein required for colicin V production
VFIDICFALYILLSITLGYRFGLFRRLIAMAAFFAGLWLARGLSADVSIQMGWNKGNHPVAAHFAVFILIVLVLLIVAEVLGYAYRGPLQFFNALVFDRFFGAIAGAIFAVVQLTVVLILFGAMLATPGPTGGGQAEIIAQLADSANHSAIAKGMVRLEPNVEVIFRPFLPDGLPTYFARTFA